MLEGRQSSGSILFVARLVIIPAGMISPTDQTLQRALALLEQRQFDQAIAALRQLISVDPSHAEAHFYLGNVQHLLGKYDEAIGSYRRSLEIQPRVPSVLNNLAAVLRSFGEPQEAVTVYREALEIEPQSALLHSNLGGALQEAGHLDEAIEEFHEALRLQPDLSEAKGSLGLALLLRGELLQGFRLYESRLALDRHRMPEQDKGTRRQGDKETNAVLFPVSPRPRVSASHPTLPFWDGSPLNGKRILLRSEQGFGDTIQFIRYAQWVRERGGRVIVGAPPELKRLLTGQLGIEQVVSKGDPLAPCDVQCMLMSLPVHFQTTLQTIPATVPYLHADPKLVEVFRRRIDEKSEMRMSKSETNPKFEEEMLKTSLSNSGFTFSDLFRISNFGFRASKPLRVGLVWAGGPRTKHDRTRSLHLSSLTGLFEIPGVQWYSLQKGLAGQQLADLSFGNRQSEIGNVVDWTSDLTDFADTPALIANLDLVISADTAVAHLAGALGKPVWTLISYVPDWRWLLGREDSPWYPTMRLFRQPGMGEWGPVIEKVAEELKRLGNHPAFRLGS